MLPRVAVVWSFVLCDSVVFFLCFPRAYSAYLFITMFMLNTFTLKQTMQQRRRLSKIRSVKSIHKSHETEAKSKREKKKKQSHTHTDTTIVVCQNREIVFPLFILLSCRCLRFSFSFFRVCVYVCVLIFT